MGQVYHQFSLPDAAYDASDSAMADMPTTASCSTCTRTLNAWSACEGTQLAFSNAGAYQNPTSGQRAAISACLALLKFCTSGSCKQVTRGASSMRCATSPLITLVIALTAW